MKRNNPIVKRSSSLILLLLLSQSLIAFIPQSNAVTPGTNLNTALAITSGRVNATFTSDNHFYKISVQAGSLLNIRLQVPSGSDLDLTLYDPDSIKDDLKKIVESKTTGQGIDEVIEYRATKTGFHYVTVTGVKITGSGLYSLVAFVTDFRVLFAGFGTQDSQIEVAAGDLGSTLSLVVRNGADFPITDFVASISLPSQFTNSTSGNLLRQTLTSTITSGQSGTFSFLVNIAPSAAIGQYPLTVTFDYTMSSGLVRGVSVNVPIQITVTGKSVIRLVTDNQFLFPEATNDLTLRLRNEGTAATGTIDFVLTVPSPLTLVGSDNKWTLASLQPRQEVAISAKVFAPSASKGQAFQLTGTATYKTTVGSSRTETRVVSLVVQAIGKGAISVVDTYWGSKGVPMLVAPGDKRVTLTVTIQNLDNGQITGITESIRLSPPFTNSTGGRSIRAFYPSSVQSGGSASTEFLLNIANDAQTRTYSLTMTVSYLDQRSLLQTIDLPVSVTIVGRSNIRTNMPSNVLLSGTASSIAIEISNSGTAPVYLANVGLSFAASSPLSVIEGDAQRLIDVIEANSKVTVPYKIYASASASEGLYAGTLTISYRDTNGQPVSETKSVGFVVKSWTSPIVVDSGDGILLAGSQNKVAIKVRNTGNQLVSSLVATLSFPSTQAGSPLSLVVGSPQFNFDQIAARGDATINTLIFAMLTSADSSYPVQIQLTYLDANGFPHSESKSVSLTVKDWVKEWVSPITVEINESTFAAGTVNKLSITIKNTANQPVSSIQSTLSFPTVSGGNPLSLAAGSPQFNFDQIPAKGETIIAPQIFATLSATDASYQLQLQITYVDAKGYQHTETKSIGVSVKGRIVIDTQGLSIVPAEVAPGSNGTVVGNLLNKGNVASHFTEARIKAEGPIKTSQASIQYIGDVDPNTPVPFSINFQVERTAAQGTYPVTVQFVYEDAYGRKFTSESKLEIRVSVARGQPQQLRIATDMVSEETARQLFIAAFAAIIIVGLAIIIRSSRKTRQTVVQ